MSARPGGSRAPDRACNQSGTWASLAAMSKFHVETLRIDPTLKFEAQALRHLWQYWNRKRGERAMPGRPDIEPLELKPHLGRLVLADVVRGGPETRFRYRLIGTAVTDLVGRDATGKFLDDLYGVNYEFMIVAYRWVAANRRPLRVTGDLRHAQREWVHIESLDLPLSRDGETVDMILTRSVYS